jgi:hypothetical protein
MSGLPFQQINPRQDAAPSDTLYQQRLAERANLDTFGQSTGTGTPQFQPQPSQQQFQTSQQQFQPQPSQQQFQTSQQQFQPQPSQQQFQPLSPLHNNFQPNQQAPLQIQHQPQQYQSLPAAIKPLLPPPTVVAPPGPPPHPSVISTFLALDASAQQRFSIANPLAYAQLYYAINGTPAPAPVSFQQPQQPQTTEDVFRKKTIVSKKSKSKSSASASLSKSREPISESDNFHSSDEELNKPIKPISNITRLPVDFRNSLQNITEDGSYVLNIPQQQIREIELESCIINRTNELEREPYIYISIKEFPGDYQIPVFGKLIQEKTVNEFIFYKPDNCRKTFRKPITIDKLTVSFLNYDQTPISLGKINIRDLSNGKTYCKLRTIGSHHLTTGDSINISYKSKSHNRITVESLVIIDVLNQETIITERPVREIKPEDNCLFDRLQLKCSLTFRIS